MASNNSTTEKLLNPNIFGTPATLSQVVEGSLAPVGGGNSTTAQYSQLSQQMQQLETLAQAETETAEANAQATNQVATASPQGSGGAALGSQGASQAGSLLESTLGLGLSPLITGILGLFGGGGGGGGGASVPSTFLMPPSVNVNAGINEGSPTQPFAVDYAAGGQPRAATSSGSSGGSGQMIVQVQAMDSQSFLDHSDDIAQAVRQAMLQSSVLNDVIREV
jgi:hypothetical protein